MHGETEPALEVKFYLDLHRVTRPWRRTLTDGSDIKFPWCVFRWTGAWSALRARTCSCRASVNWCWRRARWGPCSGGGGGGGGAWLFIHGRQPEVTLSALQPMRMRWRVWQEVTEWKEAVFRSCFSLRQCLIAKIVTFGWRPWMKNG